MGFERFMACCIMDLQDFYGLNQYIEIPRGTEKYSRSRKGRQHRMKSGLFLIHPLKACTSRPPFTCQAEEYF